MWTQSLQFHFMTVLLCTAFSNKKGLIMPASGRSTMSQVADPQVTSLDTRFAPFEKAMCEAQMPPIAIHTFRYYYERLLRGDTGYIPNQDALPVSDLPNEADLTDYQGAGQEALQRLIVLKLNGGLGTSMGMTGPKSLIEVKEGQTFLDVVVQQVLQLRRESGARVPLVLMNSFNTHDASLEALAHYPSIESDIPLDFVQHKEPKIWVETLAPAQWPDDPEKEWCPPGHGDIYPALLSSGMLQQMLDAGYEYAFVSNIDNLGATVDTEILGYFAAENLPFLMEVTRRTQADRKGGHLARRPDGGLLLREIAQCPPEDLDEFQNINRYRYFNTNNLWIHLPTLKAVLDQQDGLLGLPMIRNEKPVDPTQPDSPRVYQLETAMGLAISSFDGAQALEVSRARFRPVKKSNDILVLWSDVYRLTDDYRIELIDERDDEPLVELDDRFYTLFGDLKERFPHGAPSLRACRRLEVKGNVYFGKDVVIKGNVEIVRDGEKPHRIEDGAVLEG
jgi:UTP--glucose-1-phosphate uridylyltransferase